MQLLDDTPCQATLQAEVEANESKGDRYRFGLGIGVLGSPGIDHVLVEELRVGVGQGAGLQFVVGLGLGVGQQRRG